MWGWYNWVLLRHSVGLMYIIVRSSFSFQLVNCSSHFISQQICNTHILISYMIHTILPVGNCQRNAKIIFLIIKQKNKDNKVNEFILTIRYYKYIVTQRIVLIHQGIFNTRSRHSRLTFNTEHWDPEPQAIISRSNKPTMAFQNSSILVACSLSTKVTIKGSFHLSIYMWNSLKLV